MDAFSKLSTYARVVLGGALILLILSFLHWEDVGGFGVNEWHGVGILAGLFVIALLAWEVLRLSAANVSLGTLDQGLVSAGLALVTALFTFIAFLTNDVYRAWPAWAGLLVAIAIGAAAVVRARAEGVQLAQGTSSGSGGHAAPSPPAEPAGTTDPPDIPAE